MRFRSIGEGLDGGAPHDAVVRLASRRAQAELFDAADAPLPRPGGT